MVSHATINYTHQPVAALRFFVGVQVTLTLPQAGVELWVHLYDVDDPSANPEDADDAMSIVDDESMPSDNRGALFFPQDFSFTDDTGAALFVFSVSFRPGDNYRAVAAFLPGVFNGFTARQNDGELARVVNDAGQEPARPNPPLGFRVMQALEILTVWRRLHVEVDSMGPVRGNTFHGLIELVGAGDPGISIVFTRHNLDDSVDRFENGWLTDSVGNLFRVIDNTAGPNFQVKVDNLLGGVQPAAGAFSLVDDDLLQDGQDVPMPDTSTLAAAMAEAYVQVLFDVGDSNDNVVMFVRNVADPDIAAPNVAAFNQIITDNWTSRNSNSEMFWVAYVLGAFQEGKGRDGDPDSERIVSGRTGNPGGGCLIYIESSRDAAARAGVSVAVEEQDTVVHEVGHAVAKSILHPVTGADAQDRGLMIGATSADGIVVTHLNPSRYQPAYLAMIRSTSKPLGP